jgi:hypothetical protein
MTVTYSGKYPDGTLDSASQQFDVPVNSGTSHWSFNFGPVYDDTGGLHANQTGPSGTLSYHLSWTNPDGTPGAGASSPTFTYMCT